jgi:ribosomal protein S3
VAIVIGRQGANIREIQAKTETRIEFKDELETEEFRVAVVR